jgi:hypothetical protein
VPEKVTRAFLSSLPQSKWFSRTVHGQFLGMARRRSRVPDMWSKPSVSVPQQNNLILLGATRAGNHSICSIPPLHKGGILWGSRYTYAVYVWSTVPVSQGAGPFALLILYCATQNAYALRSEHPKEIKLYNENTFDLLHFSALQSMPTTVLRT